MSVLSGACRILRDITRHVPPLGPVVTVVGLPPRTAMLDGQLDRLWIRRESFRCHLITHTHIILLCETTALLRRDCHCVVPRGGPTTPPRTHCAADSNWLINSSPDSRTENRYLRDAGARTHGQLRADKLTS